MRLTNAYLNVVPEGARRNSERVAIFARELFIPMLLQVDLNTRQKVPGVMLYHPPLRSTKAMSQEEQASSVTVGEGGLRLLSGVIST